ncbi:MAG: bacillithiol system redox-active protein YtxJ [Bacteroidia bacterium]|nr:bacillithiol system redox-active protein YtxJ [Bacteroidia bacterium]
MNKIVLETLEQVEAIQTKLGFSLIFKHSTRCPVSRTALKKVESDTEFANSKIDFYYLDLLKFRDISNNIATVFAVQHQSPQILIIKNGQCTFNASHSDIIPSEILQKIAN